MNDEYIATSKLSPHFAPREWEQWEQQETRISFGILYGCVFFLQNPLCEMGLPKRGCMGGLLLAWVRVTKVSSNGSDGLAAGMATYNI
jgi:hypothetical protein